MALNTLHLMLAEAQPAQPGGNPLALLVPMIVVMGVFMYLQHRSQKKKITEHQQMMEKLKSGDRVLTGAGIVGTVVNVKDKTVTIRTAGDTKLEFTRSAITEITQASSESSAS
jgi:preprotein translocase subunit YajC